MNKEIAQLIKTLNGGLKHLPDLAKQMVDQYVMGHAVIGAAVLVAAVILGVVCFKLTQELIKFHQKESKLENEAVELDTQASNIDDELSNLSKKYSALTHTGADYEQVDRRRRETNIKSEQLYDRQKQLYDWKSLVIGQQNKVSDKSLPFWFSSMITGGLSLFTFVASLKLIYQALTPIWSIIQGLR